MDERIGFYQSCQNRGVLDVCLCCGGVSCVGREWVGGFGPGSGRVLCLCEMWVWILCVDGRSRYLCIVLGGYKRI